MEGKNEMSLAPVLFVGAFTLDTLYTVEGFAAGPSKYFAKERVCQAAGMATTAATAAARLGGKATLWASLGDDVVGDSLLTEIEAEGGKLPPCTPCRGRSLGQRHYRRRQCG